MPSPAPLTRPLSLSARLASAALSAWLAGPVLAANLPAGFSETRLAGGLNPSALQVAPDGRLFMLDKSGKVRVFKDGQLLPTPFLTLDVDSHEERGLLGIAFHPSFADTPWVYLYYTAKNPSRNRVSRFRAQGDVAAPGETVLLDTETLTSVGWHNGGALLFGKDRKLYVATGNNVNNGYSQSVGALLGKVLRLNPDGSIPADNPFYATATGNNRAVWSLGLRNPFTMAVHPVTGRILVNDVGQGGFEEVNEGKAGANYGWPMAEGRVSNPPTVNAGAYANPAAAYSHNDGCALTGGTFYHPPANTFGAAWLDLYFISDYCGGWIKTVDPANGHAIKAFATGIQRPIDLKVGPDGSLYYLTRGARAPGVGGGSAADNTSTADGAVYRIQGSAKPTGLRTGGPARAMPLAGGTSIVAPMGAKGLQVFDLSGRLAWEGALDSRTAGRAAKLPASLAQGIYRVRAY